MMLSVGYRDLVFEGNNRHEQKEICKNNNRYFNDNAADVPYALPTYRTAFS